MSRTMQKGLHVNVFKHPAFAGCPAGGLSERFDTLTLVDVDGPFEVTPEYPAIILKSFRIGGDVHVWAEPLANPTGNRYMHGGSYISTSDSRFGEAIRRLGGVSGVALQFHDRQEF